MTSANNNTPEKPDFLVIGAARSGTTWLYHRLKRHSGIFVTPVKEIHYFDIHRAYPALHWIRLRRLVLHIRRYFEYLLNKEGTNQESIWWKFKWGVRYFFGPKTNSWYSSLFRDDLGRVSGELTPAYATLSADEVFEMGSINPQMKVIFQMRDPIERAWSQTVMHLGLHKRQGNYEQYKDEIRRVIFSDEVLHRSDYLYTIDNWEKVFGAEQMCYLFYDEIQEDPVGMLRHLFNFLGVSDAEGRPTDNSVSKKVAARDTRGRKIPQDIECELAQHFLPMLRRLEQRLVGGYPAVWRARAESLLGVKAA